MLVRSLSLFIISILLATCLTLATTEGSSMMEHTMHSSPSFRHRIGHADELQVKQRAAAAVIGTVVADAASLGLHWVYDTASIQQVVGTGTPEFLPPQAAWHSLRKAGDTTMYGEATMVTLRSIMDKKRWSAPHFVTSYLTSFGPGGTYVGYADHATKDTVVAYLLLQKAQSVALRPTAGLVVPPAVRAFLAQKLRGLAEDFTGDELLATVRTQLAAIAPDASHDVIAFVEGAARRLDELNARIVGSEDNQSNVLAKLPVVAGRYAGHRELMHVVFEALRATANSDESTTWGSWVARVLEAVILGTNLTDAVKYNLDHLEQPYRAAIESAVKAAVEDADVIATVKRFGQECSLNNAVPASIYLLLRHQGHTTYTQAVRENIMAGGDSAGRALIIGSILGAVYGAGTAEGIPNEWIERLTPAIRAEVQTLATDLHEPVHIAAHVSSAHLPATTGAGASGAATAAVGAEGEVMVSEHVEVRHKSHVGSSGFLSARSDS